MLSTDEFKSWAKDVVLFCHVTTGIEGRKDEDLLSRKGGNGFPYLVAMDAEGRVTALLEGNRDVDGFTDLIAKGKEYGAKKADKALPVSEAVDLLCFDVSVGNLDLDGFKAAAAALKDPSASDKAKIDGMVLGMEIRKVLEGTNGRDPASRQAAGKAFAGMLEAGRAPDSESELLQPFYILMLDHAEAVKDAALFGKALEVLRAKFGDNPQASGFFQKQDERLAALKAPAEEPKEGEK